MSALVLASLAVLLPTTAVALWNFLSAPRLRAYGPARFGPLVSVLVPARDEAENLPRLLPALLASEYERLEVVVLDDGSTDDTAGLVSGMAARDGRLRLVTSLSRPEGWTWKNWACHQLSHHARGDILLFCDADVVPGPLAVARTVAALQERDADVLTAFPRHAPGGWLEEAALPLVVQLPIAALLPLSLVPRRGPASLSVGNGQWLAWRAAAYRRMGGHRAVAGDVLEDVLLARRAKAAALRLLPVVAGEDLTVRMYRSPAAVAEGLSRTLYLLGGARDATLAPALGLFLLAMGVPLLLPFGGGSPITLAPLALLLTTRAASAALFRQRWTTIALHPVGVVAVVGLALASRTLHRAGRIRWKGRLVAACAANGGDLGSAR